MSIELKMLSLNRCVIASQVIFIEQGKLLKMSLSSPEMTPYHNHNSTIGSITERFRLVRWINTRLSPFYSRKSHLNFWFFNFNISQQDCSTPWWFQNLGGKWNSCLYGVWGKINPKMLIKIYIIQFQKMNFRSLDTIF